MVRRKWSAVFYCFTKQDKLKPGAADRNVEVYKTKLLETWEDLPDIYITSAEKSGDEILKMGGDEI